jgi:hypothetical protein
MTSRERCLLALRHEEADRVPITDPPWEPTVARWRREGLPEDQSPHDFFGYERVAQGIDTSFQLPNHGWPVILHTDGDVRPQVPLFLEAGYDCLQPLEV